MVQNSVWQWYYRHSDSVAKVVPFAAECDRFDDYLCDIVYISESEWVCRHNFILEDSMPIFGACIRKKKIAC